MKRDAVPLAVVSMHYDGQDLVTYREIPAEAHAWGVSAKRWRSAIHVPELSTGPLDDRYVRAAFAFAGDELAIQFARAWYPVLRFDYGIPQVDDVRGGATGHS